MGRAPCCDKANVKRGPWSPEEDATLKSYLQKHGTGGNWISLPQRAGLKRCGKSCRLRWLNYLRPDIKHGAFTEEEDNTIISLYSKMGSRWSVIAANLPGRTDNDVKNHWNTKLKKKLFGGGGGGGGEGIRSNNKFNPSTTPKIKNVTFTNIINPLFQAPSSSSTSTPSPSPSPSYLDNSHNYSANHDANHHQFYVTIPSFSDLLAQCTSNAPMSSSLPSYYPFASLDPPNYNHNSALNSSSAPQYSLDQSVFPQTRMISQSNSTLTATGSAYPPQKEVVSITTTPMGAYQSSLEDDPFLSELGFGLVQEVMMNPTCGYDDQEDIKPQGLGQGVANY